MKIFRSTTPPVLAGQRLLLALLVALLLLPGLQASRHWLPEGALSGAYTTAPHPDFSWVGLRNNVYQQHLEKYAGDRLGFRSFLVRLHNQVLYSGFGLTRSPDIIRGQKGVLFMPTYLRAYLGQDSMTAEDIRCQGLRLRMLQRDLAEHGINFLFVLAPSKARFEPENLPPHPPPSATTNYDRFVRQMQANKVPLLNCVPLFAAWKHTKPYPLYPRGGIHWSGYGATLIADTLLRQLEASGHYQLRDFRAVGRPAIVRSSDSLRGTDNDLNATLNLLFRQEATPLAYPHIQFEPLRAGQTQPSLLLVSDSYCWGLTQFAPYLQQEFAADSRIWFYNRTVCIPDSTDPVNGARRDGEVEKLNLRQELEKRRTVVLMMTEFNLPEREFWFTQQVFQLYHPFTGDDWVAIERLVAKLLQQYQAHDPDGAKADPKRFEDRARHDAMQQIEAERITSLLAAPPGSR